MKQNATGTLAGLCLVLAGLVARAWAGEPPRYKLTPGQELKYDQIGDSTYQNGAFHSEGHWTAWVVHKNDDGSVRVVLRITSKFQQIMNGKPVGNDEPNTELAYVDLFPDGHFARNDSLGFRVEPSNVFPKLPPDAAAAKSWDQDVAFGQIRYAADSASSREGDFVFHSESQSPENEIYLITNSNTFYLDLNRGVITRVDNRNSQGYGFKSTGHGKTTLAGVEARPADWTAKLDQESQAYFAAKQAYQRDIDLAEAEPGKAEALLSQAEQSLSGARAKLTLPDLTKLADEQLSRHGQMAGYIKEQSQRMAEVLNHPASDWSLRDMAGQSHSLADYRGKIVLLDFWYRGCGWCMRAMPQVKQVVTEFKNEPVVVLGMNTDRDEGDAKFVVDKMGLNYDVLRADQSIPQKYGVRGFPTLIIIDQQGVVRDVHVGYSPNLREKVEQSVRRLLPKATE